MTAVNHDQRLTEQFSGEFVQPGDPAYDHARSVFNAMIDKHPALIARCTGTDDVVAAIHLARKAGRELAVRSGGHSVAGMSSCEDGVVIDLRPMKGILIDPALRRARVGAGVTWGEFDAAAQEFGLATTGGRISTTGVSGLTLGGGSGWLERSLGLACDNLISVEVVTADGHVLTASDSSNADLFWALHGGGGNFGVVTSLEFRLHPVGPTVLAGLLLWPGSAGSELVRRHRDLVAAAPEELGSAVGFITGPAEEHVPRQLQGTLCGAVVVCYAGAVEDGRALLEPLRAFGPPDADLVRAMPYVDVQKLFDGANPAGRRNHWTSHHLRELDDDAIDAFVSHALRMPSPHAQSLVFPWGGAVARAGEDATPMAHRDAGWITHALAMWHEPGDDGEHTGWAHGFAADMQRFACGGVYLNFVGDEGEHRVRAAYGRHYGRLAEIKAKYDPENIFRLNHNIKPAGWDGDHRGAVATTTSGRHPGRYPR